MSERSEIDEENEEAEWAQHLNLYDLLSRRMQTEKQPERDPNELLTTRLVSGVRIQLKRKRIVGWCHNDLHRGAMTRDIFLEHDCFGKQCTCFEPNPVSTYLLSLKEKKRSKERIKQEIRIKKQKAATITDNMQQMREKWQGILDDMGSDMQIVRIERPSGYEYIIFYVSDNRFADGNRFPEFLEKIRAAYPRRRIILRHIRALDGHFVTREEYNALKR